MGETDGSTETLLLQAMREDPEIVGLLLRIGAKYPYDQASALVQSVIEQTSTSALTAEYGSSRPSGIDFFKFQLGRLVDE